MGAPPSGTDLPPGNRMSPAWCYANQATIPHQQEKPTAAGAKRACCGKTQHLEPPLADNRWANLVLEHEPLRFPPAVLQGPQVALARRDMGWELPFSRLLRKGQSGRHFSADKFRLHGILLYEKEYKTVRTVYSMPEQSVRSFRYQVNGQKHGFQHTGWYWWGWPGRLSRSCEGPTPVWTMTPGSIPRCRQTSGDTASGLRSMSTRAQASANVRMRQNCCKTQFWFINGVNWSERSC